MRIMGVSGMPGSGKSFISDIACERGAIMVSMGDIIREEAKKRGEPSKETAKNLRKEFGNEIDGSSFGFVEKGTGLNAVCALFGKIFYKMRERSSTVDNILNQDHVRPGYVPFQIQMHLNKARGLGA